MTANEAWFHWYTQQIDKPKDWQTYRDRLLCPCCHMPTLVERAVFDICPTCDWEDDGQDSDDADTVRGGPNADYSLTEARANFASHLTMYRPDDTRAFTRSTSDRETKRAMVESFLHAMHSDADSDWQSSLELETRLFGRD